MPDLLKTEQDGLTFFQSPQFLAYPQIRHGFFTRLGGVSTGDFASLNFRFTVTTMTRSCATMRSQPMSWGMAENDIVRTNQQHTDCIEVVTGHPG